MTFLKTAVVTVMFAAIVAHARPCFIFSTTGGESHFGTQSMRRGEACHGGEDRNQKGRRKIDAMML